VFACEVVGFGMPTDIPTQSPRQMNIKTVTITRMRLYQREAGITRTD